MKILGAVGLFIVLIIGLARPLLDLYDFIFKPSGGNGAVSVLDFSTLIGFTFSYLFAITFVLNLLRSKKRFIWIAILVLPFFWFFSDVGERYLLYPLAIIVSAFALSELAKFIYRRVKTPKVIV